MFLRCFCQAAENEYRMPLVGYQGLLTEKQSTRRSQKRSLTCPQGAATVSLLEGGALILFWTRWSGTSDIEVPGIADTGVAAGYYIIIIMGTIYIAVNELMISLLIDHVFKTSSQSIRQDTRTIGRVHKVRTRLPLQSSTAFLKDVLQPKQPDQQIGHLLQQTDDLSHSRRLQDAEILHQIQSFLC